MSLRLQKINDQLRSGANTTATRNASRGKSMRIENDVLARARPLARLMISRQSCLPSRMQ
jgi:hypothetical protein